MSKKMLKACLRNNIDEAKELLKVSFGIGYKNKRNQTYLYWACFHNNIELINLLLENGDKDSINVIEYSNRTCLYWACYHNNIELVKFLLDNGARDTINVINHSNRTCLHWACDNNNTELVKLLLDNGAIIDGKTKERYYNYLLGARL